MRHNVTILVVLMMVVVCTAAVAQTAKSPEQAREELLAIQRADTWYGWLEDRLPRLTTVIRAGEFCDEYSVLCFNDGFSEDTLPTRIEHIELVMEVIQDRLTAIQKEVESLQELLEGMRSR